MGKVKRIQWRGDESHLIGAERRGRRSLQCFRYISLVRERELSQEQGYVRGMTKWTYRCVQYGHWNCPIWTLPYSQFE